jgi:hypothetical protein
LLAAVAVDGVIFHSQPAAAAAAVAARVSLIDHSRSPFRQKAAPGRPFGPSTSVAAMDGMAAMDRLEDSISIASQTLQLKEFLLEKANITDDDLDYFFNYTVVLVQKTDMSTLATIPGLESDDSTNSDEPETVDGSYTGCGMGLHKPSVHLVHGILSLIICLAGCLANIVNIVVLSRRELRRNAINRILCSLAVADFLLMLEYIPFACHMYLFPGRSLQTRYSYPWAVFVLFHAHFTLVRIEEFRLKSTRASFIIRETEFV